jgi:hypothetical protein
MPATILAYQIVGLKMASNNVQLQFLHPGGNVAFCAVIPTADFTSLNTNVNGGSPGATLTLPSPQSFYAQDASKTDYPIGYTVSL